MGQLNVSPENAATRALSTSRSFAWSFVQDQFAGLRAVDTGLRTIPGRACVFLIAFFALAACAFAGSISGIVRNGTTGQLAVGVDVILIQLQGGMQPVANTKTDSQGRYHFDHPSLGAAPMLIRVAYRGVNYHEPVPPGKDTADVEIFEPTNKQNSFAVTAHAIILQPNGSTLTVGEEYSINNATQPPVAYYRDDGSFLFTLPDGAQLQEVSAAGSSGMPVVQGTIDKRRNESAIAFPFRPGESSVRISYTLPYPGNHAAIHFTSTYASARVAFFAPPTVQISSDGFAPAGSEQGFNAYMRESVPANTPLSVSVSGTAPPAPQNGGADSSQSPNPSQGAESGAAAPVAGVTPIPARLDSLRWILVGGFAAIFVLGFLYLWMRPQTASSVATAAGTPVAIGLPASADGAAPFAAAAEVTSAVRGSLDELKDSLFRLELRRQAGTISEEDYTRDRQRIDQTLRDLVRG